MTSLPDLARLLAAFRESRLGYHLHADAEAIFPLGDLRRLAREESLPGHRASSHHVMLEGRLAATDGRWHGPGNHFPGGDGHLQALDDPTWVWTLETGSGAWRSKAHENLRRAWEKAMSAALSDELDAGPPVPLPDPTELCDYDHPTVVAAARELERDTPAATAEAVFHAIQAMPYRFGLWQEKASRTLARGTGMCTTKANLQVAILRALGIRAGFVEVPLEIGVLGALMPEPWRRLMRSQVRHYFAAVELGGRWHPADASFCYASCALFIEAAPWLGLMVPVWFKEGRPFHPVSYIQGTDPFAIEVMPEIHLEMGKKSRFHPRHFEAMNTRLDRLWRDEHHRLDGRPPEGPIPPRPGSHTNEGHTR